MPIKKQLLSFNRKLRKRLPKKEERALKPCKYCGYPSVSGVCSFCKYFLGKESKKD